MLQALFSSLHYVNLVLQGFFSIPIFHSSPFYTRSRFHPRFLPDIILLFYYSVLFLTLLSYSSIFNPCPFPSILFLILHSLLSISSLLLFTLPPQLYPSVPSSSSTGRTFFYSPLLPSSPYLIFHPHLASVPLLIYSIIHL